MQFDDVAHIKKIQEVSTEILDALHAGLVEIARIPITPNSAVEMKSVAEQTLIRAHCITQELGGVFNNA